MQATKRDESVEARLAWAVVVAAGAQRSLDRALRLHRVLPRVVAVAIAVGVLVAPLGGPATVVARWPQVVAGFGTAAVLWWCGTGSPRAIEAAHARLVRAVFEEADRSGRAAALVLARDVEPLGWSWWAPWAPVRASRALRDPGGRPLRAEAGRRGSAGVAVRPRHRGPDHPAARRGARPARHASASALNALAALDALADLADERRAPPAERRTRSA